jgi:hypothetical protein
MFEKLIDRILTASWERVGEQRKRREEKNAAPALTLSTHEGPPHGNRMRQNRMRQFTIHDAMNGQYIEYMRRKYNPNGPDDWAKEIYIVQPDEALIDAIGAVLVILEK